MQTVDIDQTPLSNSYRKKNGAKVPTSESVSSIMRKIACSNSLYNSHILPPSATCNPAAVIARSKRFLAFEIPRVEHSRTDASYS